ncbi:MAG TPA: hypothetical protein VNJ06_11860 [Gemmatimonadales bacterium]|nr:hypothetical protein [Gemmatimonadales bacterium]
MKDFRKRHEGAAALPPHPAWRHRHGALRTRLADATRMKARTLPLS